LCTHTRVFQSLATQSTVSRVFAKYEPVKAPAAKRVQATQVVRGAQGEKVVCRVARFLPELQQAVSDAIARGAARDVRGAIRLLRHEPLLARERSPSDIYVCAGGRVVNFYRHSGHGFIWASYADD
jgi:hypothetical protein